MKIKSLNDLKKWVNKLSEDELSKPLIYNSEEHSISGSVSEIKKATTDLYYTGDDDPAQLYTKKQLKEEEGYDQEDIEGFQRKTPS